MDRYCRSCSEEVPLLSKVCSECGEGYKWNLSTACLSCSKTVDYTEYKDCPNCGSELAIWRAIERVCLSEGEILVSKDSIPNPTSQGYYLHIGHPQFQMADYRRMSDGSEFHIVSKKGVYQMHLDRISAIQNPIKHTVDYINRGGLFSIGRKV